MPGLNVQFTEDELILLRKRARTTGFSLARLVHDDAVCNTERASHDAAVMESAARVAKISEGLLKRLADK